MQQTCQWGKKQSGLLRVYLHSVSHPLVRVQTWGVWLLTWLNLKLRRRLADKLMLLRITCFPELLRHNLINRDTSHCWFVYTHWNFFKPAWKGVCGTPCSRILPPNLILFSIIICKQPLQLLLVFTAVPFPPSTSVCKVLFWGRITRNLEFLVCKDLWNISLPTVDLPMAFQIYRDVKNNCKKCKGRK